MSSQSPAKRPVLEVAAWIAGILSAIAAVIVLLIALLGSGDPSSREPSSGSSGPPSMTATASSPPTAQPSSTAPSSTQSSTTQPPAAPGPEDIDFSIEPHMGSSEIAENVYQSANGKLTVEWVYKVLGPSGPVTPCNVNRTVTNLGTGEAVERSGPLPCQPLVQRVFIPVGRYRVQADFYLADLDISKTLTWEFEVR